MSAPPNRKVATAGILVGLLLSALDGTLIATALPKILGELNARLMNDPEHEFGIAAAEQQRITAIRLARLVADELSES